MKYGFSVGEPVKITNPLYLGETGVILEFPEDSSNDARVIVKLDNGVHLILNAATDLEPLNKGSWV